MMQLMNHISADLHCWVWIRAPMCVVRVHAWYTTDTCSLDASDLTQTYAGDP